MWRFFQNIIEKIVAGTDRELMRIQDSRKYFLAWMSIIITTLGYSALAIFGDFTLDFDQAFKIVQDWTETVVIIVGMYQGINAYLEGKSNKTKTINEKVEHTYKVTNDEDESDPEKMEL